MRGDRGANSNECGSVSRDEIDRLFDRELSSEERRAIVERIRHDPEALEEVIEMHRLSGCFRQHLHPPDLTSRVLRDVERRRGFLSARLRRRVRQGRALVAASLLLAAFSLAVAHRAYPDVFRLHDEPTPVTDFGQAFIQDSLESGRVLAEAVSRLEPIVHLEAPVESVDSPGLAGLAELAEFHVPVGPEACVPDEAPEQYIVLAASTDAEMLALGGARNMFTSIELSSAVDDDGSFAVSGQSWSSSRRFAYMAFWGMRLDPGAGDWFKIEPGVVPLSVMPETGSAYIGRLAPPGDGHIGHGRANPHPDVHRRVLNQSDDR